MGVVFAAANILLAVLTLSMANSAGLDQFRGNAMLHLVPIYATIFVAAVVMVLYVISPREPAGRLYTGDLTQESRELLLDERARALRVLLERGLLPREDLNALDARPLGELDAAAEDARGT